eukprot:11269966-Alexandrium_andersonii.AAC.1
MFASVSRECDPEVHVCVQRCLAFRRMWWLCPEIRPQVRAIYAHLESRANSACGGQGTGEGAARDVQG